MSRPDSGSAAHAGRASDRVSLPEPVGGIEAYRERALFEGSRVERAIAPHGGARACRRPAADQGSVGGWRAGRGMPEWIRST